MLVDVEFDISLILLLLFVILFYMVHKIPEKYAGIHWVPGMMMVLLYLSNTSLISDLSITNINTFSIVFGITLVCFGFYKDWLGWMKK